MGLVVADSFGGGMFVNSVVVFLSFYLGCCIDV